MNKWFEIVNKSWSFARFFTTTNVAFDSKANVISRNLGLPERPKKPMTGYFRYLNEVRPVVSQSAKTPKEVPVIAAAQWKKLDEGQKQKYNQAFLNEKAVWLKQLEAYEKKLTKDQKLAIKDERIRLKELEEKRAQKLELKTRQTKLGKPKQPLSAFLLFHVEENKKSKTNVRNTKVKYDALSETQKSAYKQKANALREEYKKALETWEKRMASKGMLDLIRKPSKTSKTPKLSKSK